MIFSEHAGHSVRTRHRTGALQFLMTCDETALPELELAIAALPLCARGRLFIEVPSEDDIGLVTVPPRMTVTWLARSRRSGPPGTGEACQRGMAVGRAAKAWAAEMLLGDGDGDGDGEDDARSAPCRVWLGGDWRGVAELHDHLTRELGLPASVVRTRDDYRLG